MLFLGLLIVSVALLQNAVAFAVSATSDEVTVTCTDVTRCFRNHENSLAFNQVLARFAIEEVYTASQSWCDARNTVMEECWNNRCDNQTLRYEMAFEEDIKSWICSRRESFNTASHCYQGSLLGRRFDGCANQALSDLRRVVSTFHPVAYVNYFRLCGHDVIDDLVAPCQEEDKNFLKEFFYYASMMGPNVRSHMI